MRPANCFFTLEMLKESTYAKIGEKETSHSYLGYVAANQSSTMAAAET